VCSSDLMGKARDAQTAGQLLASVGSYEQALGASVAAAARTIALNTLAVDTVEIDVAIFDRAGKLIAQTGG